MFILIIVICLLGGIIFAGMAIWLTTTKGNTINDILAAKHFEKAEALKTEIIDKIKLSTNIPIIALYVLSVVVAMGLPIFIVIVQQNSIIELIGDIRDYDLLINQNKGEKIYVTYKDAEIMPGGRFTIPVWYSRNSQEITFQSPVTHPITLTIKLNLLENALEVYKESYEPQKIKINNNMATLGPISIDKIIEKSSIPLNQPSVIPKAMTPIK
jgi:hypothetical protein